MDWLLDGFESDSDWIRMWIGAGPGAVDAAGVHPEGRGERVGGAGHGQSRAHQDGAAVLPGARAKVELFRARFLLNGPFCPSSSARRPASATPSPGASAWRRASSS